jgi:hypothetical protein
MNQDVQELVTCIKKVLVYYKLYVKAVPEYLPPTVWDIVREKISVDITTEEQVQEVLALTEEMLILESNYEPTEDLPQPFEIKSAVDSLKSAYSKLKGD